MSTECLLSWMWQSPPKAVSAPLPQGPLLASHCWKLGSTPFKASLSTRPGPSPQSPSLPGSSPVIFSTEKHAPLPLLSRQRSLGSHGWDSWFFWVPQISQVQPNSVFPRLHLGLPTAPFSLSTLSLLSIISFFFFCPVSNDMMPKDNSGRIKLLSILLSAGHASSFLSVNVPRILLPQGLCTCCPLPRMFFLQISEYMTPCHLGYVHIGSFLRATSWASILKVAPFPFHYQSHYSFYLLFCITVNNFLVFIFTFYPYLTPWEKGLYLSWSLLYPLAPTKPIQTSNLEHGLVAISIVYAAGGLA